MSEHGRGRLRIAIVAPPWFEVPPQAYGGIESVCAGLADRLVARGHQVTLVGAGRDRTAADFLATRSEPPSDRSGEPLPEVLHAAAAGRMLQDLNLDLVHDHTLAGLLLAAGRSLPTVVTAHGPVDGELGAYYRQLGTGLALVAISDAQRGGAPDLPWVGTVHNAIDVDDYPLQANKDDYLLFLGRFSPEKGAHLAIDAARAAGRTILLAGKCNEPAERDYFLAEISPRLGPDVWLVGEADATAKRELLARAACLLFPVCWAEPFGLVMIEALACGTPVVGLARGSVPEVLIDGVTGFVCQDPGELPDAIGRVPSLDPGRLRQDARRRFDLTAMVTGYEQVYRRLLAQREALRLARPAS
jgi:glycosyltransferase involved in cell wall biosynthesis